MVGPRGVDNLSFQSQIDTDLRLFMYDMRITTFEPIWQDFENHCCPNFVGVGARYKPTSDFYGTPSQNALLDQYADNESTLVHSGTMYMSQENPVVF